MRIRNVVGLVLVLFSLSFNILVKRQVVRRTAELTKEVAERKRAEEQRRKAEAYAKRTGKLKRVG